MDLGTETWAPRPRSGPGGVAGSAPAAPQWPGVGGGLCPPLEASHRAANQCPGAHVGHGGGGLRPVSTLATATRGCLLGIGSVRWMDKLGLSGLHPDAQGGGVAGWLCLGPPGVALQWLPLGTWTGRDATFVSHFSSWRCHSLLVLMCVGHEQAALLAQKVNMSRREGSEWTLQGKQLMAFWVLQIWFSSDRDNQLEPAC